MLFKSIKSTTTAYLTFVLIFISCIVLIVSIQENRRISLESLSSEHNLVSGYIGQELTRSKVTSLQNLRQAEISKYLDNFKNITNAAIYDSEWQPQDSYIKDAYDINDLNLEKYLKSLNMTQGEVSEVINNVLITVTNTAVDINSNKYLLIMSDASELLGSNTKTLLKHTIPLLVVLITLCAALGFATQGKLLHPLKLLTNFAQDVEVRKDYSIEIKALDKKELVDLGESINSMLRTINTEYSKSRELSKALKESQKNMERLANFDRLTGFPNRQFFMETLRIELAKVMREKQDLVLIYFELEGLKDIYDANGHEVGDQLLIQACKRVKGFLREGDIISRLDDSEFLILLHNQPTDFMLVNIAERLIKEISAPFIINTRNIDVTTSLGLAKASDSHFNLSELIKNADIAMYRSKIIGANTHTFFVPDMMKDNKRKVLIAASIEEAIENEEFTICYQSRMSEGERVVAYDISVHWESRALGHVSESEFMVIAVQNEKGCAIYERVLEAVCQELPTIYQLGDPNIVLSINLSTANIKNNNLIEFIKKTFAYYQINPANIEFKLSELEYLENYELASEFLKELRGIGVGNTLGNFGCGYSALGYLCHLDLTTIRIDKQFIDNLMLSQRSTLVVKNILKIAKKLEIQVCADGVEIREQEEFLTLIGCHQMAGFLFSKQCSLAHLIHYAAQLAVKTLTKDRQPLSII